MIRRDCYTTAAILAAWLLGPAWLTDGIARAGEAPSSRKPNIIFILADDLGYGDVGVFYQNSRAGKPRFATPHLDQMAAQGMMLYNHYTAAPVCAPARASLLLGQHQGHCPIRDNQFDKALPSNHTLATVLKQAGYHTACIGKWGLQGRLADLYPGHPLRHGFQEFFGFLEHTSGHTYYHDAKKPLRDGWDDVTAQYQDIYSTDLFTARAKQFITDRATAHANEPFFLCLAYTAIHNPLHVPGNAYPAGAGKTGGLQWPLAPTPVARDTWIHPDYRDTGWPEPMQRYATMARRLDDGVGDLLQLLRDLGLDRNTLVIFTSDNGPANEGGADPRNFDSWGPFDGFKRDCWEGGVREPTMAWWPGHVPAGAASDVLSGFWDWMPTLADAAGLAPPAQSDGVSLLPTLTGAGLQRSRGYVYGEYFVDGKNAASADVFARKGVTGRGQQQFLRTGDLVAIRTQIKSHQDPLRLYNVHTDPHEDHNLAAVTNSGQMASLKDAMLTVRRPEPSAPRPYDNELLPAVAVSGATSGVLDCAAFEGRWPWVPDFDALTPLRTTRTSGLDLAARTRDTDVGLRFSGYINAPTDGQYTFYLTSDGGAQMWLHDAHLLDDDFNHNGSEVSATIGLKAGLHPLRVFYRHAAGPRRLDLQYSGPGLAKQVAPPAAFCAAGDAAVAPKEKMTLSVQEADPAAATAPPNVVVILADDMGYSDLGCYGSEIQTPNLDGLAANGVRFTQFYNTSRCCPARACLLSGLYSHQAGVGLMTEDKGLEGFRGDLNRRCVTIAEVLHGAGYRTYMTGKWHVTKFFYPRDEASHDNWPRQRGFDWYFGTIMGGGSYFDPGMLTRDDKRVPPGDNFYYTDQIGEHAVEAITEHHSQHSDRPFFLYAAFTAPHWPLHAKPQDIAKYRGHYDKGWDVLRQERYHRQIAMGLVKEQWPLTPRDTQAPPWDSVTDKAWYARRMEVFAAQVDCLDQNVGRIIAALKSTGQLDNTLVLFLSDNGGCAEEQGSTGKPRTVPLKDQSPGPMAKDELQSLLVPPKTRDGRPVWQGTGVMPGAADTYLSYGLPWANLSNTPFRLYKHWEHEGGISTPLIAHWPAGIKRHGVFENQPGHLIDIMATCVDLAGAAYPTEYHGQKIQPMEGCSLVPAFAGKPLERKAPLFWEHEGNRAMRDGKWKLVAKRPDGPWELYDMEADRTEMHDLTAAEPARAKVMAGQWEQWGRRTGAIPWPWGGPYGKKDASQK